MKYITTDVHPHIREGVGVELNDERMASHYYPEGALLVYCGVDFLDHLHSGYIKEVEEKEFTKSDMIEFANWCINNGNYSDTIYFNNWIKQRKK